MNTLNTPSLPLWISILFLIVILVPVFLIANLARKNSKDTLQNKVFFTISGFYLVYFIYVCTACLNGLFNTTALPPMILRYSTFPFLIFLFGIVIRNSSYKTLLHSTPLSDLVKLHIFRLIGFTFILLAWHDAIPKYFAILAGLGDVFTALSSIWVAKAIEQRKSYAKLVTYCWNIFGLVDILFTSIGSNVLTKIAIETGSQGVEILAQFPFCLIPAFAPPTILFLHYSIFKKLKEIYH